MKKTLLHHHPLKPSPPTSPHRLSSSIPLLETRPKPQSTILALNPHNPPAPNPQTHNAPSTIHPDTISINRLADHHRKSGLFADALHLLGTMPHPNLYSFNLMISCYNHTSRFNRSLHTFNHSRFSGYSPDVYTYGGVLAACIASQNVRFGERVHAIVVKNGYCGNGYVSSALIDLYAKGSCYGDALRAFNEGSAENVVCWNAMISGSVKNGENGAALELFSRMIRGLCMPNGITFSSVLSACAAERELVLGRGVHAWVVKCNAEDDVFINTAMIDFYAKSGDMDAAVEVFYRMPVRNVVSWTAIISGFVQEEDAISALKFFKQMVRTSVEINKFTLTSVLSACAKSLMEIESLQIHCWALKTGLFTDPVVKDALIHTYAKIGDVEISEEVFEETSNTKSLDTWSTMISGLSLGQRKGKSIQLFKRMFLEGLMPDSKCCSSVLSIVNCIRFGQQVHSYALKGGLVLDVLVGSSLFTMYSKCGNFEDSYALFKQMKERDRISCTSMVSGLAGHEHPDEAIWLFREMICEGINPDRMALIAVLGACNDSQFLLKGKEIHAFALRAGFGSETLICSALMHMYSTCKSIGSAMRVFYESPEKDEVIWSSLVSGCAANGYKEEALSVFHDMVISGYEIDHIISSSIIGVCASLSRPGPSVQLHGHAIKTGLILDIPLSSALVTLYSKCGSLDDSRRVFDEIEKPDLVAWTTMIDGYAQHGHIEEALRVFHLMKEAQVKPDSMAFTSVLSACSHGGMVEEAFALFNSMSSGYGVEPQKHHFACMVDLLGRSGKLNEAADLIARMPMEPDSLIWSTLLSACRVHGDVELGRIAAKKALELEPRGSGAYINLSNISAEKGDWDEVVSIRTSLDEGHVKKQPGLSMV